MTTATFTDVTGEIAIMYLTPERFAACPQAGVRVVKEPHALLRWLTWPSFADDKRAHGAWCPCDLEGGRVKGGRGPVSLLVGDVDDCGPDGIERSAAALAPYAGAVIPTFSATREKAKHRIVLLPSRAIAPEEFQHAWSRMARELETLGIRLDRGCKNVNRLYFACVARSPEAWMGARILTGAPVPIDEMLLAAREEAEEERRERERLARERRPVRSADRERYVTAALDRARDNIASAPEGGRHDALLREAYSLARLGLSADQVEVELLEAFVIAAGEARRFEGHRAIRDAVAARGRGAA